jgi:hypothetical protein
MPPLTGLREGGGGAVATNISLLTGLRTPPGEVGNAAAWIANRQCRCVVRKLRGGASWGADMTRGQPLRADGFSKPRTGRHSSPNPVRGDMFVENVEQKEIS